MSAELTSLPSVRGHWSPEPRAHDSAAASRGPQSHVHDLLKHPSRIRNPSNYVDNPEADRNGDYGQETEPEQSLQPETLKRRDKDHHNWKMDDVYGEALASDH